MHIFYAPHVMGNTHQLDEAESRHAIRALRLASGERIVVVDGAGGWYECVVDDPHPKRCTLEVLSYTPDYRNLPYELHLAVSPTKNMERFEWFIEKATEIGISEITPLLCHRTERSRVNVDRMERIIISAMKQSRRAYKPILQPISLLRPFLKRDEAATKGIAHCIAMGESISTSENTTSVQTDTGKQIHISELPRQSPYSFLVGPEGDFTEEEVMMALDAGYTPIHLGESRLRTETAAVYICAAINLMY